MDGWMDGFVADGLQSAEGHGQNIACTSYCRGNNMCGTKQRRTLVECRAGQIDKQTNVHVIFAPFVRPVTSTQGAPNSPF